MINTIAMIKNGGRKMRLTSLMVVFLISRTTGQYCQTYCKLLLIAVAVGLL